MFSPLRRPLNFLVRGLLLVVIDATNLTPIFSGDKTRFASASVMGDEFVRHISADQEVDFENSVGGWQIVGGRGCIVGKPDIFSDVFIDCCWEESSGRIPALLKNITKPGLHPLPSSTVEHTTPALAIPIVRIATAGSPDQSESHEPWDQTAFMPKRSKGNAKPTLPLGANWLALKSTLDNTANPPKKKRRISTISSLVEASSSAFAEKALTTTNAFATERLSQTKKGADNDIPYLRSMILGHTVVAPTLSSTYPLTNAKIGKYVALDCEMVGVGPRVVDERTGKVITESSLARVSLVNYHGEVIMDTFVRQKERVTDYRTHASGVRPKDVVGPDALSLEDVQRRVADVLKGRTLVGHAVFNDLKVLFLKHDSADVKDTQKNPAIRTAYNTPRPALRTVIQKEFDLDIQSGEHSSVTDARAAMALYRIYKNRPEGRHKKSRPDKESSDGGGGSVQLRVYSSKEAGSMPFTESKNAVLSDFETEVGSDVDNVCLREGKSPPQSEFRNRPLSGSKKRKRASDSTADPPLVLHVAPNSTQEMPKISPNLSRVSPTVTSVMSTKKMSRRTTSGKFSRIPGVGHPGGGKKGISSGLSTIIRTRGTKKPAGREERNGRTSVANSSGQDDWWSKL